MWRAIYIEEEYLLNNDLIIPYKQFINNEESRIEKNDKEEKSIKKKKNKNKSEEKHTNKIINFLEDTTNEKDIEKDFIKNLEIKLNSRADNIDNKIIINSFIIGNAINITDINDMENYIKDKNNYFIFNEKLKSSELYIKYKFTKYFCRTIGPVIFSKCSGINKNGSNVYKIINSIEEFK